MKHVLKFSPPDQPPNTEANELIKAVDEMLESMTNKFAKFSTEVFTKRKRFDGQIPFISLTAPILTSG